MCVLRERDPTCSKRPERENLDLKNAARLVANRHTTGEVARHNFLGEEKNAAAPLAELSSFLFLFLFDLSLFFIHSKFRFFFA